MGIDKEILDAYKLKKSIKATVAHTGYSWNRVVKSLSSNGIILNDTHQKIIDLYNHKIPVCDIASQLKISTKTAESYIPRTRPVYNESPSPNAMRIRKCRDGKKSDKKEAPEP